MLAIGEDNFRSFSKWKDYEEILEIASLIVFERPDAQALPDFTPTASMKIFRVALSIDEASTELRAKISRGIYPSAELPQALLRYIAEKQLYRK
jgi:nicotinic acid mononucleotide adenylyltransferase